MSRTRKDAARGRAALLLAAGALLASLAGCGGDDPTDTLGGGSGDGGSMFDDEPSIVATFDLSGDVTLKKTVDTVMPRNRDGAKPASCAEYAKGFSGGAGTTFVLPTFALDEKIDGHRLILDGQVTDYTGPASYPLEKLAGNGSAIGFVIDDHPLQPKDGGDVSVTVNADGSGEFTFDQLAEVNSGPWSISGKLTWTCKNP